jgi:general secretion pathway protein M
MLGIPRNRWTGSALFLALHVGLAVLGYATLWLPLQQMTNAQAEAVAERQAILARYNGIIAQENAVIAYAKEVKDRNAKGELLEAQNEGVANANLQAHLKGLAETAGVQLQSVRALPNRTVGALPFIGARIELSGHVAAVQSLLHSLEGGTAALIVTSAILRPNQIARLPNTKEEPLLDVQLDVYGGLLIRDRS